jgi:integrase
MQLAEVVQEQSVASYLDAWLAHTAGRVRVKTWQGYECLIRLYARPALGELALSELGPLDLQRLYAALLARPGRPLSGGSVLNLHLVLTQALSQAVRWGYLASNPASGAQPPRPRRPEPAPVDAPASGRILAASRGTRLECPVAIAIATGMRRGEILALRWSDLDPDLSVARVRRSLQPTRGGLVFEPPKTKRSRRAVMLPAFLRPYLVRQKKDQDARRTDAGAAWCETDLVIDRGDGQPLHPDTLSSGWRALLARAALPHVRFHDLRHAHATLMLQQGVHPKVVSERLGHASVGITLDTYSHVLPAMQAEATRAFDELFPGPSPGGAPSN